MMAGLYPHANVRTMVGPAEISLLLIYTSDPFLHRCSGCLHLYSRSSRPCFAGNANATTNFSLPRYCLPSILLQGNNSRLSTPLLAAICFAICTEADTYLEACGDRG